VNVFFKSYIFMTCGLELLVFSEPDHPEVGLQIPGGTLDPGESYLIGAKREFEEETALPLDMALDHLVDEDYVHRFKDGSIHGLHKRRYFHARVGHKPRERWQHYEMTPSFGGPPIRFDLHWVDISMPGIACPEIFHAGFDKPLRLLREGI